MRITFSNSLITLYFFKDTHFEAAFQAMSPPLLFAHSSFCNPSFFSSFDFFIGH